MARTERVVYSCDVCGRKIEAQFVKNEANSYFVRPDGWGHIYVTAQKEEKKVQRKVDFCSLDCLTSVYDAWVEEAYDVAYED